MRREWWWRCRLLWPAGGRGGDGAWIWVIEMMVGGGSIIFGAVVLTS